MSFDIVLSAKTSFVSLRPDPSVQPRPAAGGREGGGEPPHGRGPNPAALPGAAAHLKVGQTHSEIKSGDLNRSCCVALSCFTRVLPVGESHLWAAARLFGPNFQNFPANDRLPEN